MARVISNSAVRIYIIATLFLYSSAFFINYFVKNTLSLHWGKDGGIVSIAFFHCISSYIFFLILNRSTIAFLGLGFFVGLFSCAIIIFLPIIEIWDNPDWFIYILGQQIFACTIVFLLGISCSLFLNAINKPK